MPGGTSQHPRKKIFFTPWHSKDTSRLKLFSVNLEQSHQKFEHSFVTTLTTP